MAIEKTPSKNWELTLYETQRTPQPLITDESEIAICPLRLSNELKCPICLDFLNNTMATKECLHRFCAQCIVTALRSGNKECPACRKKLVSKRSLRHDHNFDAIIAKLFPYRKEYEAHQANVMAKQIRNSMKSSSSVKSSELKLEKMADNEPQTSETVSSNNETESGSSKGHSNSLSSCPSKYRNSKNPERTASIHSSKEMAPSTVNENDSKASDSVETIQPHQKQQRRQRQQSSSDSNEPETNCSSSITSDLCSSVMGGLNPPSASLTGAATASAGIDDHLIDIVLEPLDGRGGKNRLNEAFVLQLPDTATVGHLMELLSQKRSEYYKTKKNSLDGEPSNKMSKPGSAVFVVFLAVSIVPEKRVSSVTVTESGLSTGAASSTAMATTASSAAPVACKKSLSKRLEAREHLGQLVRQHANSGQRRRRYKSKTGPGKIASTEDEIFNTEFVVFYYQETAKMALETI